jgi:LmbE family N-acetylglucosaminyl deacetylase
VPLDGGSTAIQVLLGVFAVAFGVMVMTAVMLRHEVSRHWRWPSRMWRVVLTVAFPLFALDVAAVAFGLDRFPGAAALLTVVNVVALLGTAVGIGAARIAPAPARIPRRVLAIGAHPDDIEIACGGALAKFVDSGHEVHALVFTSGGAAGDAAMRSAEARASSHFLELTSLTLLDLPDSTLSEHGRTMIEAIEAALARHNPDIVLTHSAHDRHQDHHAAHMATIRAARSHPAVLAYESPSATEEFTPRFFIDIDQYIDTKTAALSLHCSQKGKPYIAAEHVKALAVVRGRQGAVKHAEGFEPIRLLDSRLRQL